MARGWCLRTVYNLVRLARPEQWIKNVFVFAALVFSRKVTDPAAILDAVIGFVAFCLASSAIYALNDVFDRKADACHPQKRRRPVASGEIGLAGAAVYSAVLAAAALAMAFVLRVPFGGSVVAYLVVTLAYVLGLKRVAILDVLILSAGFVIRAYAGGKAIDVWVSPWLILCTLTVALFLGFAKRESERVALGAAAAAARPVEWDIYDEKGLAHKMTVSAGLAIVTYMLYTINPETIERVGHPWMLLTVFPALYAVFRFHHMAITGRAGDPTEMIRRDAPFVVSLVAWVAMVAVLLFCFGKHAVWRPLG